MRQRVLTDYRAGRDFHHIAHKQGIGLADFVPASLAAEIDWAATYVNSFTAGPAGLRRSRLPMVLPDEESCIKAALSMCGVAIDRPKRVVRIDSTLHLTRAWVSDAVLAELPTNVRVVAGCNGRDLPVGS